MRIEAAFPATVAIVSPARDLAAVRGRDGKCQRRVDEPEGECGEVETGDDPSLAGDETRGRFGIGRNNGIGGEIAGEAEILNERSTDQRLEDYVRGPCEVHQATSASVRVCATSKACVRSSVRAKEEVSFRGNRAGNAAAAFLAPQGSDDDHQADKRGIIAARKRIEFGRGVRKSPPSRSTPAARERIGRTDCASPGCKIWLIGPGGRKAL